MKKDNPVQVFLSTKIFIEHLQMTASKNNATFNELFSLPYRTLKRKHCMNKLSTVNFFFCQNSFVFWNVTRNATRFFRSPIYNPFEHLWWSFYCENRKPLNIFTKKLHRRCSLTLQTFYFFKIFYIIRLLKSVVST